MVDVVGTFGALFIGGFIAAVYVSPYPFYQDIYIVTDSRVSFRPKLSLISNYIPKIQQSWKFLWGNTCYISFSTSYFSLQGWHHMVCNASSLCVRSYDIYRALDFFHTIWVATALWDHLIAHFGETHRIDFIPWSLAVSISLSNFPVTCSRRRP